MNNAGIDVSVFKLHCVRPTATSKAKINNACVLDIVQTAGSKFMTTFAKFYDKPIERVKPLSTSVLK